MSKVFGETQMFRYLIIAVILFAFSLYTVQAGTDKASYFVGITPSITAEPFYDAGEYDVNIFPLVYQKNIFNKIDVRITSIINYGIRKYENKISHVGIEMAFPIQLFSQVLSRGLSEGFFIAPILSIAQEQIAKEKHFGLWIEPGYQFIVSRYYSMSLGLQMGGTWIESDLTDHLGVNFIIGRWF